ncbi:MAG: proline iminopeptidase-family hydrolase [Actinomycetota bacterium]
MVSHHGGPRWALAPRLRARRPGSTHHYFAPLEELAQSGRAVVVYDQVGCGGSSRPPIEELGLEVFVDELANLHDRLGLERTHVLGTSWGGMVALEHALTGPPSLQSLILSSTLVCARSWAREAARLRDAMPQELRRALADPADPAYERADAAFFEHHVCRLGITPEIERMREQKGTYVYEGLWGPNEWTLNEELARWDVRDRVTEIEVPVLITAGRHDLCTPNILAELQRGLPRAETVRVDDSAHMPYLEQPDDYRASLRAFLDRVDAPGG